MHNYYLGFKFMLSYFTLFPIRFQKSDNLASASVLAAMLFWLPLAGLLLGTVSVGLYLIVEKLGWLSALIAALSYPILYGFIHTEAVMDVADALYAKHAGKDAYAVIKEPTVGAMGVLWAITVLLLKTAVLAYLFQHKAFLLILTVPIVSRLGLLFLLFTQKFRSSFIEKMQIAFTQNTFFASLLFFTLIGMLLNGWHYLILLSSGLFFSTLFSKQLKRKLGFLNGDVLGTTLESTEIILFILGALLWL